MDDRRRWWVGSVAVALGLLAALFWWWLLPSSEPVAFAPPPPRPVASPAAPAPTPAPRPPAARPRSEAQAPSASPDAPTEDGPPSLAWMTIDVVDADGRPVDRGSVQPVDCPGFGYHPPTRMHFAFVGTCSVRAIRRDGALFARSEPTEVNLLAGNANYLQLQLTATRTGGIGIRFRPGARGMVVLSIVEGAPAWDAGLEVGDQVVSVDGEAVNGMSSEEFIERMTGAEGTDVVFEVLYEDDDGDRVDEVAVTRQYLDG